VKGRQHRRGSEGQAAVELALALPLVALLLLALVQLGFLVRDEVLVVHAAREGVRQAAVDSSADAVRRAAAASAGLAPDRMQVSMTGRGAPGSHVQVTVTYKAPTDVPLVGAAIGDIEMHASATMRVETDGASGASKTPNRNR
jgi:Flp pilus assembly protein TadG